MIKDGLLYTQDHEWISIEGDVGTIGITDHAQEMLGEITFADLPTVGKQVSAHDEIGVVESSKAASDIYSPATGKVTEVNGELESKPELINEDCYGQGWMCKLQITDKSSTEKLMNAKQYEEYLTGL